MQHMDMDTAHLAQGRVKQGGSFIITGLNMELQYMKNP